MSVAEVSVPEVSVPEVTVPVSVLADTSGTDASGTQTGTVSQQPGPPDYAASPFFVANNICGGAAFWITPIVVNSTVLSCIMFGHCSFCIMRHQPCQVQCNKCQVEECLYRFQAIQPSGWLQPVDDQFPIG